MIMSVLFVFVLDGMYRGSKYIKLEEIADEALLLCESKLVTIISYCVWTVISLYLLVEGFSPIAVFCSEI